MFLVFKDNLRRMDESKSIRLTIVENGLAEAMSS